MEKKKLQKSRISIVIVTWNCADYIRHTIESIKEQTMVDFDILVIDNASSDDTIDILKNNYKDTVKIVQQKQNLGFSKGYNYGIHWTKGDYVLVMNQDVVLDKQFLEYASAFLDAEKDVAAVQGKILHWDSVSNKRKDIIDTCGLVMRPNHQVENLFEGLKSSDIPEDFQKPEQVIPIFGFSGSCVLLRREALETVRFENEFFDEDFFAYKEDIDLSWRLRHANWDIVYLQKAIAYHGRSLKGVRDKKHRTVIGHRKTKSPLYNMMSYRNNLYMLFKNEYFKNILYYFFPLAWYEIKKKVYIILFERSTLRAYSDIWKNFGRMRQKRKKIIKKSKMPPESFRNWVEK